MGRADEIRARYEAELELAEAEDELSAAKSKNTTPDDLRDIKNRVRALRQSFREQRDGDAVASPDAIKTTAAPKKAGGK